VPQRSASLAHVVPPAALASRAPANESDIAPLGPYLAALRDPEAPAASFEWRSLHEARIEANIAPGLLLSVQVNYHPGWRASANGSAARVFADHLGLLAIEPGCAGPCTVDLVFGRSPEARLMRALSLMAAAAAAWLAAARGLRRVSL